MTPQQGNTGGIGSTTTGILTPVTNRATLAQTAVTGDPDVFFPKIEANYNLVFGAGYIKPFAGFQYYTVNSSAPTQGVQDKIDLYSYVLGVSTNWNIGAFSIGGQLAMARTRASATGIRATIISISSCPFLRPMGKTFTTPSTTRP